MNCEDLKRYLAEGGRTGAPQVAKHLSECAGCRALLETLESPQEMPDAEHLSAITTRIQASLTAVRPLPSDGKMILAACILFAAFSLLATMPFGYYGFRDLTNLQRLAYYLPISLLALLLSGSLVKQIIPGAAVHIRPGYVLSVVLLSLPAVAFVLFPHLTLLHFVASGFPCLRVGLLCGAASGALTYLFARKGYAVSPPLAGCIAGVFAGLAGFAVLALHCPLQNAWHVVAWHFSAVLICGVFGLLLGFSGLAKSR